MMRFPRTGCWYRFTPADWEFIGRSLALTEGNRNCLTSLVDDPDAIRFIIDQPRLFEALVMGRQAAMVSPELFFLVTVRHTLKRIGVDDIELADYMAVVCADFGLHNSKVGTEKVESEGLYSIDYVQALENARSRDKFFIHVQCANQFMVLTCLFPSYLHRRAERRGAPDVDYYEKVVMSHLDAAGRHALSQEFALHDVLLRLAGTFPPVRRAMNYTLSEYLNLGN